MSQTAYTLIADKAFQGMLGDAANPPDILSRCHEGASVPFGIGVRFGTDPVTQVQPFSSTGQSMAGILVHEHKEENRALALDLGLVATDMTQVLRKGRIWVLAEETIVPDTSAPFVRHTANGGLDQPGAFRTDADTANADDFSAVATFLDYFAVAGLAHNAVGLALLDIHLP